MTQDIATVEAASARASSALDGENERTGLADRDGEEERKRDRFERAAVETGEAESMVVMWMRTQSTQPRRNPLPAICQLNPRNCSVSSNFRQGKEVGERGKGEAMKTKNAQTMAG
jgi:hypothetical protein